MKTTVLIKDELYSLLVREAKEEYGSMRKLSELVNVILAKHFSKKKNLFGSTKRFNLDDVREEKDRF
ncbi:MAG: hypothetical protein AABX38_02710 [Candidatus Micrarchaeota archaeon]